MCLSLTIAIYSRALHIEANAGGQGFIPDGRQAVATVAARAASCALQLEALWRGGFEDVVWFVASPDLQFKQRLITEYHGRSNRTVMALQTHGQHSRPDRKYNSHMVDYEQGVVEGLADWWLLGEADLIVLEGSGSYGSTAAARRPHTRSVYRLNEMSGSASGSLDCGEHAFTQPWSREPREVNATTSVYRTQGRLEHFRYREHKGLTVKLWGAMRRFLDARAGGVYPAEDVRNAVANAKDPELLQRYPDLLRTLMESGFVWDEGGRYLSFHLPPAVTQRWRPPSDST